MRHREDTTDRSGKKPLLRWGLRAVRWTGVAVVLGWALYLIGINLFLSTGLFDRVINRPQEVVWVGYGRGWSVFPGTIHARDLVIRGRDGAVEWTLRIDRVVFDVSFRDLARKRFTASDVRGEGVTFHGRRRLPSPAVTADHVAHVPRIEGLPPLPVRPPELPGPELWSDEAWDLWTVDLRDVVAEHVRDVWVDRERFEGDARVAGRFRLKPLRDVQIGPIAIDARHGTAASDGAHIVTSVHGRLDFTIAPFDPRTTEGAAAFAKLSLGTDLTLEADLGALPRRLTDGRALRGKVRLTSRSRAAEPGTSALVVEAELREIDLDGVAHVPLARVTADAERLRFVPPFEGLHATLAVPDAAVPDARALDRWAKSDDGAFAFLRGEARLRGEVEAWPGERRARGTVQLEASPLAVRVAKVRIEGETTAELRVGHLRWGEAPELRDASLEARVTRASVAPIEGRRAIEVSGLEATMTSDVVDLADPLRAFSARVSVEDGRFVDRGLLAAYLPKRGEMRLAATPARFRARTEVVVTNHRARGTIDASAPSLGLELGPLRFEAKARAHARVRDWDWERGDLALDDARVDLERLVATRRETRKEAGDAMTPAMRVERIRVRAKSSRFAFADPLARVELAASVDGGVLADSAALNVFLPRDADVTLAANGGAFEADVRAEIVAHVARGHVRARAAALGIAGKRLFVRGDVDVAADIDAWRLDEDVLSLAGAALTVTDAEGRLRPGTHRDFAAEEVALVGRNPSFDLAHPSLRGFDCRLVVREARLDDARSLNALLPPGEALRIEGGRARARADVLLSTSERAGSGGVVVEVDRADLRVGNVRLRGDLVVEGALRGFDPEASELDVRGSRVSARNVRVDGAAAETEGWRGELSILEGVLALRPEPRFEAAARFLADDATPILALVVGDALPGFLVSLVKAPELDARARLLVAPETVALREVDARGGDVSLRGAMVVRGERQRGAFVVGKGPFSAGVGIRDDRSWPRLFGLDGWLREQTPRVDRLLAEPSRAR